MKVSQSLKVSREVHPQLGEIIVLYSPRSSDGKAYFTEKRNEVEQGMGLRLTKRTALKLGRTLLKLAEGK